MAAQPDSTPPKPAIHKWASRADATAGFLITGRVVGAWRTGGHVLVEPLTDFADRFDSGQTIWVRGVRHAIESSAPNGARVVVKLSGVDSAEEADALKGLYFEIPESEQRELEPDRYYEFQIVGLRVLTGEGQPLGTVTEILRTGSNDVYIVRDDDAELLIPAIDDVVKEIDLERGEMIVELLEGLMPPKKANR